MANLLAQYGIKEVADVTFYNKVNGNLVPKLYLDSLKVSTIEQTAETAEAKGGKGNSTLIIWDYGKEITVTLEDALFSMKSMSMMFGNGTVDTTNTESLYKTLQYTPSTSVTAIPSKLPDINGQMYDVSGAIAYDATGASVDPASLSVNTTYYVTFPLAISERQEVVISPTTFPGNYYVTGDTYARSQASGTDEYFQFIIEQAKIQSENTITMEADGDPSVFNLNLRVLRPATGDMMKLVKYSLTEAEA